MREAFKKALKFSEYIKKNVQLLIAFSFFFLMHLVIIPSYVQFHGQSIRVLSQNVY